MRCLRLMGFMLAVIVTVASTCYAREIQFTQDDRDRLRNMELKLERLEEGQKSLQRQIDDFKGCTQRQFDNLYTLILWGFGILFGGMGVLIGFVIWDRRTALAPAVSKAKELEEREEALERVLKEYAKTEPRMAEILKSAHLM